MSVPMRFIARLLEAPDIIQFGARTAIRKHLTSIREYNNGTGLSSPPIQIDIKLVDACNLRCKMCPQWGDSGYNLTRPTSSVKHAVPLDVYQHLMDEVAYFSPWIFLWGGEPMLYPDILPLISYIKKKGMPISLVTNGTLMKDRIPQIVENKLDVLLFSIDGPRDTHDCIRGYKGAFDQTIRAVQEVLQERKMRRQAKPFVAFVSVITSDNQHNFGEIFDLAEDLGIDLVLPVCSWYQTAESGRKQTEILEERMGITPWSWKGYLLDVQKIDPAVVRQGIRRVKARKWRFHYKFYPPIPEEKLDAFFHDHSDNLGFTTCTAPWVSAEILPNGDVANCRDYPDVVAGNIKSTPFMELWNKGRLVEFRKLLIDQGGRLPVCNRCHGLMGC